MANSKTYFASDLHLGVPNHKSSLERERLFIKWLDEVRQDAENIFLVGDLFDFWFEYKYVVPKGNIRLLAKLATLKEQGINIEVFTGNHDLWMFGYFQEELNIPVHHDVIRRNIGGKEFMIGHGDGKGPKDKGYKRMKKLFTSPICQKLFSWVHPDIAFKVARSWSVYSRETQHVEQFLGNDKEWLAQYALKKLESEDINYFIFGHRHLPLDIQLTEKAKYVNLGDWLSHFSFAEFDGDKLELKYYKDQ